MILSVPMLILALAATGATGASQPQGNPHVTFDTTMGKFVLELYPDKAPPRLGGKTR